MDWAPEIQSSPLAPSMVSYSWSISMTTAYLCLGSIGSPSPSCEYQA